MRRRAVFLDRDGTLNADSPDFVKSVAELHVYPEAAPALARLAAAGFELVVVTNQSGLARGLFPPAELERIHEALRARLSPVRLLDIVLCPHHPDDRCSCRKPLPGLIDEACRRHGLDPARSFMVGDRESDVLAGERAGCTSVLVAREGAPPATRARWVVRDLAEAAARILEAAGA